LTNGQEKTMGMTKLESPVKEDGEKQGREFLERLSKPAKTVEEAISELRRGK
jgi:hypothetical protein